MELTFIYEQGSEENFDDTDEEQRRFNHGANDFQQDRLTAREVAMLGVMNALTDKPHWEEKVLDDEISNKWGEEARQIHLMSEKAWEWCLLELRDKAERFKKTGRVLVLDTGSRISKSEATVPEALNRELRHAVQPLHDLPEDEKDWHPGSEGKVLDTVHPSLFPLVFGRTRALSDGGIVPLDFSNAQPFDAHEQVAPQPPTAGRRSPKFQWLPCEVKFTESTGMDVAITSYINNLHPKNKSAYAAIEKIISLAIPAWNEVLVRGHDGRTPPRIRTYGAQFAGELPSWYGELQAAERNRHEDPEAYREARRKVAEYCGYEDRVEEEDEDEIDVEDECMSVDEDELGPEYVEENGLTSTVDTYYERHVRQVVHPEPGVSFTYSQWKAGLTGRGVVPGSRSLEDSDSDEDEPRKDHDYYSIRIQDEFRDEGLQVIVKLASIELTPDKPTHEGGSWHVEGLPHEHIVATALYYYDVDNLTEARISFRTEARLDDERMDYEQGRYLNAPGHTIHKLKTDRDFTFRFTDDHKPLAEIFDVRSGRLRYEAAIQDLGSVTTPQGRLLAFPNTLQHKVEPFELSDKSRPGHRRFLALWLVDPHYRIPSTCNVPPQQKSWWADTGHPAPDGELLMSLDEAKKLRLELMAERTRAVKAIDSGHIFIEIVRDARRNGGPIANLATVGRHWQAEVESITFRSLRMGSQDLVAFEKLVCKGRRSSCVRTIFLNINLESLGPYFAPIHVDDLLASDNPWITNSPEHRRNQALVNISNVFARLFTILKSWNSEGRDSTRLVDVGWKITNTQDTRDFNQADELLKTSVALRCDFSRLPETSLIGSVSAFDDGSAFRLHPSSALALMRKTPNVHTTHINLGPGLLNPVAPSYNNAAEQALRSLPNGLKVISLGSEGHFDDYASRLYRPDNNEHSILTESIADLGLYLHNLEDLKLERVANVGQFFTQQSMPNAKLRWPRLRNLEIVGDWPNWNAQSNDIMFLDVAQALYGMPRLRKMDVLTNSIRVCLGFQLAPENSHWPAWPEFAVLYIRSYVPPPELVEIWKAAVGRQWGVPVLGYTYKPDETNFLPWKDPHMGCESEAEAISANHDTVAAQKAELEHWRSRAEKGSRTGAVNTDGWRAWNEVAGVEDKW
ncbi:hypothetical protein N0V82_003829 [Gnomoniopsis sp. IMI 355080]|nr:hypothetical protein N0V82_003829 [Gnomoniopsis sp. IMI 355080]